MRRVDLAWARAGLATLAVVAVAHTAAAERVRTTDTTKVYKGTGEQSGVVTKIAEGTTLKVLNTEGRWLKVRVNGRTGWVTRSSVTSLDDDGDVPRNTRRRPFVDGRSTRRGWGSGAPDDRVGADATGGDDGDGGDGGDDGDAGDDGDRTARPAKPAKPAKPDRRASRDDDGDDGDGGDDDGGDGEVDDHADVLVVIASKAKLYPRPSRKAKAARSLKRGARLTMLERKGEWIRVETDDDAGYVRAGDVDLAGEPDLERPRRMVMTKARLGFASVGGTFTSDGAAGATNPPAGYKFGSNALSVNLGVEVAYAYKRDYFIGGGVEYLGCLATPGIHYANADIGFKTHDVDLRAIGGYDFHSPRGTVAWGRLGYHLGIFSVSDLMNMAQIPSETFRGPSVGAGLTMPRVTPKIGAAAMVDLVYPGTRTQTKGNEDGQLQGAMATTVALTGAYAWKGAWNLEAAYRFGYAKSAWSGTSNRVMGATATERVDFTHVLTVGLGRQF